MSQSLYDQFHAAVVRYPKNEAERFENRTYTYTQLNRRILNCAKRLKTLGIQPGEIVAVSLPNCPLAIDLFYGLNAIGAISYNIHPLTPAKTLAGLMARAGAKRLFCLSLSANEDRKAFSQDLQVISINPYQGIRPLKSLVVKKMSKLSKDVIRFEKIGKAKDLTLVHPDDSADAVYLNTGGTNGDPKIVRLSNGAINYLALQGKSLIPAEIKDIKMLTAIPLFHGFGLAMGVHTPLSHGASTVLMLKFKTKEAIAHIRKGRATVIIGVPALYNALLSKPLFYGPHLAKQIISFIGGDNVSQALLDRWDKAMRDNGSKARLFEGYGLTETVTCSNVNTYGKEKKGSIGKPLPGITEKIVDVTTRKDLQPGQLGEILISGPTLMNGYFHDESQSQAVLFKDPEGRIWLSTKDYGSIDEDGYLYFKQRLRRVVKVNGEALCPKDVEDVIYRLPEVFEAYCYGVPHPKKGHCFRLAVIVRRDLASEREEVIRAKIQAAIKEALPPSYQPDRIVFYPSLPHTPVGKLDLKAFEALDPDSTR
jgi:long-chain acyl-CoA synthetase